MTFHNLILNIIDRQGFTIINVYVEIPEFQAISEKFKAFAYKYSIGGKI